MQGVLRQILKLPPELRNQLISQAGVICEKVSKANVKKMIHKEPVAYNAKTDIKQFIKVLKETLPNLPKLPNSPIQQYDFIIRPLNKRLVNISR